MTPRENATALPVLEIRSVSKRFGNLQANKNLTFSLAGGEVLALLGENGAGKTTLMNILFGHYVADSGDIFFEGKPLPQGSPSASLDLGIGMVHQHFTLGENLTVLENVLLGTESLFALSQKSAEAREKLTALSTRFGLQVNPDRLISDLSVGERQRVEILKALYRDVRVLILDEPTAVLTPQESVQLFSALRNMVSEGMSIIFISHKLAETFEIANRVVVLRRGEIAGVFDTQATSEQELAHAMVGRALPKVDRPPAAAGGVVMALQGVSVRQAEETNLYDINLTLRAGEVVGIAGVSGNGQRTLTSLLGGDITASAGELIFDGTPVTNASPRRFIDAGVARIPEDRNDVGIVGEMSIPENLIIENYRDSAFQRAGWMQGRNIEEYSQELCGVFDIRGADEAQQAKELSGGNIQKLILARVLSKQPRLIIASQPTRGLDVGAQSQVHQRLLDAKRAGAAVFLVSEDLEELFTLCDRLHVMFEGRLSLSMPIEEVDIEHIGLMMTGKNFETHNYAA